MMILQDLQRQIYVSAHCTYPSRDWTTPSLINSLCKIIPSDNPHQLSPTQAFPNPENSTYSTTSPLQQFLHEKS